VALDGQAWRTLPAEVVFAAGLDVGVELDRERARRLRRELRQHEAMSRAARSLAHRDLSVRELSDRLARAKVATEVRQEAVDRLVRAGAVDDERVARGRAELLARRGSGDLLVRHDLESRGIGAEHVEAALAALDPEVIRAEHIVTVRGQGPRTARHLARKGFSPDTIEAVCEEPIAEDAPPAVR
jgi:SOS response regulatory protein OraA/RecX